MSSPRTTVLFLAAVVTACGGRSADGAGDVPRNLLLVTLDTTRADRLGCYGYEPAETPTIDALGADGVVFDACMAPAPVTLPSHASILTGLYPHRHGARNNGSHHLAPEFETLAEVLAQGGFQTAAVVSAVVLDSRYGLDQGFDVYDDDLSGAKPSALFLMTEVRADDAVRRAGRWLDGIGRDPFFLWVHFFDPHGAYEPPEPYASRFAGAPYDGEIAYADAALGRLLGRLEDAGHLADTLVVVTADHGESLGQHGERTHGLFVYEPAVRVPLIVRHASLLRGARVERAVSAVDVFPTVLELLDVPAPEGIDGVSLAPALRDAGAAPPARALYSEAMYPLYNHGWSDLRAVRTDRWRYIRAPRPELYDLSVDPGEETNLYAARDATALTLERQLDTLLAPGERDSAQDTFGELSDDVRESLAALGYVWTDDAARAAETPAAGPRPDPKDRIEAWSEYEDALARVRRGELESAAADLRRLAEADPGAAQLLEHLAWVLNELGDKEAAREVLLDAVVLPSAPRTCLLQLAQIERELGLASWSERLRTAREADPRNPDVWTRQGDWQIEDGDLDGALRSFGRALELEPAHAGAWRGTALARFRKGDAEGSRDALAQAVRWTPRTPSELYNLAVLHEAVGAADDALALYRDVRQLQPGHLPATLNLGNLHLVRGELAQAEALFRAAIESDPTYASAHSNLGLLLVSDGRPAEAAPFLETCARLRPEDLRPRVLLLRARRELGDDGKTLDAAAGVLSIAPDHARALLTAAVASARLGRSADARAYVARARAADPERFDQIAGRDAEVAALLAELEAAEGG